MTSNTNQQVIILLQLFVRLIKEKKSSEELDNDSWTFYSYDLKRYFKEEVFTMMEVKYQILKHWDELLKNFNGKFCNFEKSKVEITRKQLCSNYWSHLSSFCKNEEEFQNLKEIFIFIDALDGINSVLKSDHMLNLFQDIEGRFPEDKKPMLKYIHRFLHCQKKNRCIIRWEGGLGFFWVLMI